MSTARALVAGVTGASGYVGGVLSDGLVSAGWDVVALSRRKHASGTSRYFDLDAPISSEVLSGMDVLVHCAWDWAPTTEDEVWSRNVQGSRRLLEAATVAGVRRVIVLSSIAAYDGTEQVYGRAKLAVERIAAENGAIVVRPGLVWGPHAGGMMGALRSMLRLRVVPVPAARSHQFLIHEADLAAVVIHAARTKIPSRAPLGAAHAVPVSMWKIVRTLAASNSSGRCFTVPLWWRPVYALLRATEKAHLSLPFRADSLWGLAHPVPLEQLHSYTDFDLRPFGANGRVQ